MIWISNIDGDRICWLLVLGCYDIEDISISNFGSFVIAAHKGKGVGMTGNELDDELGWILQ